MTDVALAGAAVGGVAPPPGLYIQIYRGKVPGSTQAARDQWLHSRLEWARVHGLPGIVMHGFSREMIRNWDRLAGIAAAHNLLAMASWGLDGSQDDGGTRLTADEKGECMAEVLGRPTCTAGVGDMEGQWDDTKDAADDMNEHGALVLGRALRRKLTQMGAPGKLFGDQPWFAIQSHGDVRRVPKPVDQGGVFAGFPVDEFAVDAVNWIRFPQFYPNDFTRRFGPKRYAKVLAWMERDWTVVDAALDKVGLRRTRSITTQMYGWELHHFVHCLLTWIYTKQLPVIGWSEAWPDAVSIVGIEAVEFLARRGFAKAGMDALEIVKAFQVSANLTADGWCGTQTCNAMGIS